MEREIKRKQGKEDIGAESSAFQFFNAGSLIKVI